VRHFNNGIFSAWYMVLRHETAATRLTGITETSRCSGSIRTLAKGTKCKVLLTGSSTKEVSGMGDTKGAGMGKIFTGGTNVTALG
jgi:hypothetical protein